jgi:hypothetical protein
MWCTVSSIGAFAPTFIEDTVRFPLSFHDLRNDFAPFLTGYDADIGKGRLQSDVYSGVPHTQYCDETHADIKIYFLKFMLSVPNDHPCHQTSFHVTFSYRDKVKVKSCAFA